MHIVNILFTIYTSTEQDAIVVSVFVLLNLHACTIACVSMTFVQYSIAICEEYIPSPTHSVFSINYERQLEIHHKKHRCKIIIMIHNKNNYL